MDEQSKTCLEEMYYLLTTLQLTLMTCSIHVLCLPLPSCTSPFYPLFTLPSLPLPSPPLPSPPPSSYADSPLPVVPTALLPSTWLPQNRTPLLVVARATTLLPTSTSILRTRTSWLCSTCPAVWSGPRSLKPLRCGAWTCTRMSLWSGVATAMWR